MAVVRIPDENRILREVPDITAYLASIDIEYERWESAHTIAPDASADEILSVYGAEIERLKQRGGYITADVIDVNPETPNLEAMLARFNREHWHDEDEIRFVPSAAATRLAPHDRGSGLLSSPKTRVPRRPAP